MNITAPRNRSGIGRRNATDCRAGLIARSQRGQVMPFTVLLLGAFTMALFILYDSGQINIERMRLQNTADATSYSVALLEARNFNYIAYTNRAMVANQVAIGQMVGLASWADYQKQAMATLNVAYPSSLAKLDSALLNLVQTFGNIVPNASASPNASAINPLLGAVIRVNDNVIASLSKVQRQFHTSAILAGIQLSSDVTMANDPDVQQVTFFGRGPTTNGLQAVVGLQQIQRPTAGASQLSKQRRRYTEFQNIVLASRDHFTANRSYVLPPPYSSIKVDKSLFSVKITINGDIKHGGTDLMQGIDTTGHYKWEWTSMDDLSVWRMTCSYSLFGGGSCGTLTEITPIAAGAAHALNSDAGNTYNYTAHSTELQRWGGAWRNKLSAPLAVAADGANKVGTLHDGGLRPFYDLGGELPVPVDDGPAIVVILTKNESKLHTTKAWSETKPGFGVANDIDTEADGGLPGQKITALSQAQIYFYRPYEEKASHNPDWNRKPLPLWAGSPIALGNVRKYEHGNVYNPFWQTHMVDTNDQERTQALSIATN